MRSLVTGGAGFIGSHLVDALADAGDEVLAIDDLSSGTRENIAAATKKGARLERADVTDAEAVAAAFEAFAPERCFHLAAQVDVRRAVADPLFDARVNVLGTINVLEAARGAGIPVAFASTGGAIYGEGVGRPVPLDESERCLPEAAYGASKLAAEGYVGLYARMLGVAGAALRLGNVYGPRQDPHGEAGVVAIFCGRLAEGGRPTVFGDGAQTRDYVYVADVVEAFVLAGERLVSGSGSAPDGPLNVGTGIETSVLELVQRMGKLAGRGDFDPVHAPERPGEVQRIALDAHVARRELGWTPRTPLDDGLDSTMASYGLASSTSARRPNTT